MSRTSLIEFYAWILFWISWTLSVAFSLPRHHLGHTPMVVVLDKNDGFGLKSFISQGMWITYSLISFYSSKFLVGAN